MFNALKYTRDLEEVGLSRKQAEAHVQIISEIVEGNLTTKQDLQSSIERLENKLIQLEYRLIIKLSAILGTIVTLAIAVTSSMVKFH